MLIGQLLHNRTGNSVKITSSQVGNSNLVQLQSKLICLKTLIIDFQKAFTRQRLHQLESTALGDVQAIADFR
ncbi:hypothetical protein D3C71_2080560 [compost metagenome]